MTDLLFQNLSTVQNSLQPNAPTIASAATIAPTSFLTFVTGTTAVTTITPPVTGTHMLVLIFTNASPGGLTAGTLAGQPKASVTITQNIPVLCIYDVSTGLYWCGVLKLS
jgi:hypothetical protein